MAQTIIHGTLTANTAAAVTLAGLYTQVVVINRSTSGTPGDIFFTVGNNGAATAATVAGADTFVAPFGNVANPTVAGIPTTTPVMGSPSQPGTTNLSLISSVAAPYTVIGIN